MGRPTKARKDKREQNRAAAPSREIQSTCFVCILLVSKKDTEDTVLLRNLTDTKS